MKDKKKYRFSFDYKWYSGEPFVLFKVVIFENYYSWDMITLFFIKIGKFCLGINLDKE